MNTNVDIMYYEYMIDSAIEDQKIMELVYSSKFNSLLNESTEEIAIYEATVFQTIIEAIEKVFQKVIDFVKGLIEKITGKLIFKMDGKLVERCKEKIKSMTAQERDNVRITQINFTDEAVKNSQWAHEQAVKLDRYLGFCIEGTNKFLNSKDKNENKVSDEQLDKLRAGIGGIYAEMDERSNVETMRKNAKSITFSGVRDMLDDYSKSDDTMAELNKTFKPVIDQMKKNQSIMNNHVKLNRDTLIKRPHDQKQLLKYREIIALVSNTIIKMCKFRLNMAVLVCRNEESILRRFLSGDSADSMVNQNYKALPARESADEYFDDMYDFVNESVIGDLP